MLGVLFWTYDKEPTRKLLTITLLVSPTQQYMAIQLGITRAQGVARYAKLLRVCMWYTLQRENQAYETGSNICNTGAAYTNHLDIIKRLSQICRPVKTYHVYSIVCYIYNHGRVNEYT